MSTLLQKIAPEFDEIISDYGFVIADVASKTEEFGNVSIILTSSSFNLRIYTDRGQRFADVSKNSQAWHKLEYVLEFIDPVCTQEWFEEPPAFDKLAGALKVNFLAVANLLSVDFNLSGFQIFEKRKSSELVAKIFGERSAY